jgi:hypothetical protein
MTDGQSALITRSLPLMTSDADWPKVLTSLFDAMGAKVTIEAKRDARFPLHGTLDGQQVSGWVWPFTCPGHTILVLGLAVDDAAANDLAELVRGNAHCK